MALGTSHSASAASSPASNGYEKGLESLNLLQLAWLCLALLVERLYEARPLGVRQLHGAQGQL